MARGSIVEQPNGRRVMLDDNRSPTDAFLWAAQQRRGLDLQFNHLFKVAVESDTYSADPDIYAAPAPCRVPPSQYSTEPAAISARMTSWGAALSPAV